MPEEELGDLQKSSDLVTDAIGQLVEFWGFKRIMGRIWTTLYLAPEPLSAKDLAHELRVSISLVSTTLNELLLWGVVQRAPRPGGRADVYEAETNLWKMVSKVFKERETFRLETAIDRLAHAKAGLGTPTGRSPDAARRRVVIARIERLERLATLIRGLLEALIEDGRLDVSGLKEISLADEGE